MSKPGKEYQIYVRWTVLILVPLLDIISFGEKEICGNVSYLMQYCVEKHSWNNLCKADSC